MVQCAGGYWTPPTSYYREETFNVTYKLQTIKVTGDASGTINGAEGDVSIRKEGENLSLSATGEWSRPEYTKPSLNNNSSGSSIHTESYGGETIPAPPPSPQGSSGQYNLDWVKPKEDYISSTSENWTNKGKDVGGYLLNATMSDNISGFSGNAAYEIKDSSYYGHNSSGTAPLGEKRWDISETLQDGIYDFIADLEDRATNTNKIKHGKYKIDLTDPTSTFDIQPNGFDGTVTIGDNLSGISYARYYWEQDSSQETQYKWNTSTNTYEPIPRFVEGGTGWTTAEGANATVNITVKKPRGDRWMLHVLVTDRAGNTIHDIYGPYNDPIKLKDFQVIDVRDLNWNHIFWNPNKTATGRTFKVNELPLNKDSNNGIPGQNIKRGYAFDYKITSEYLDFLGDNVRIEPKFYFKQRDKRFEVDLYYPNESGRYIKAGGDKDIMNILFKYFPNKELDTPDKLGQIYNLKLNEKERIVHIDDNQTWYGTYYIPADSKFVLKNHDVFAENVKSLETDTGEILVNFSVTDAYRKEEQRFQYVPNQWSLEGGSKKGYEIGDVVNYNNVSRRNAFEDIKGFTIH